MALHRSTKATTRQPAWPNIAGLEVRSKRWIEIDGRFAIGEGGAELLMAISETGSLTRGAVKVGWSYRHAWGYLRRAEMTLGIRLLSTRSGKGAVRGTELTPQGAELIQALLPS